MAWKKCDWCGEKYHVKDGLAAEFKNDTSIGGVLVPLAGGISRLAGKKNFCSNQCKVAYENQHNQGASGGEGGTTVVNKGPSAAAEFVKGMWSGQSESMQHMQNQAKDEKATREKAMQEIASMQFTTDGDEIQNQLSYLVSLYDQYKPKFGIKPMGLDRGPSDKALRSAIKEKLEFGIMKLNSIGKSAEAAYFQGKLDKLK